MGTDIRDKLTTWGVTARRLLGRTGKVLLALVILVGLALGSWAVRSAVAPARRAAAPVNLAQYGMPDVEVQLIYPVRVPYHGTVGDDAVLTVYARALSPEATEPFDLLFPLPDATLSFVGADGLPTEGRLTVQPGYPVALPYSLRLVHADTQDQPTLFAARGVRITPLLESGSVVDSVAELYFRTSVESRFGHTLRQILLWLSGWGLPLALLALLVGTAGRAWYATGLRRRQAREQRLSALYTRLRDEIKVENWPVARQRAEELRLVSPAYRDLDRLDTLISTAETATWRRDQLYNAGLEAYSQRDWPGAVQAFSAIEEESPYYREVRFLRRTAALNADLRSRDRSLRLGAAAELGEVADLLDMSPLLRALGDASLEVADAAEASFKRIGAGGVDALLEGLTVDRASVRERCYRLLQGMGQSAREALLSALHSPDPRVTGPVAHLLAGLGAREPLAQVLSTASPEHHAGIIDALMAEEAAAAEPLVDALLAAPEGRQGVLVQALSALRTRVDIERYLDARMRAAPNQAARRRLQEALRAPAEAFQGIVLTAEAMDIEPVEEDSAPLVSAPPAEPERRALRLPWPSRRRD